MVFNIKLIIIIILIGNPVDGGSCVDSSDCPVAAITASMNYNYLINQCVDECPFGSMPNSAKICSECHSDCLTCELPKDENGCKTCKKTSNFVFKLEDKDYGPCITADDCWTYGSLSAVESDINPLEINECDVCPEGYISDNTTNICKKCTTKISNFKKLDCVS